MIVLVPLKGTSIVSMGFFVKAGSRNETEDNNGIAHFLEHMMFKGTKSRSAENIFKELDILGAHYNAATTTEHTYYYVNGHMDDTKKLLDIVLDIYINPEFDTKEINKERKVIIEEMRMRADTPMMKLYMAAHSKIFKGTSLERTIIGTEETVMNLKRKDFIDFRTTMYKPNNTVFVIAGNFNPVIIYKMLEKVLQNLKNPQKNMITYSNEKEIILQNMYRQDDPYVYIKRNTLYKQVYILLCFPIYDIFNRKYKEIDLLSYLLTSGSSSRLVNALRENNGITYNSNAYPIAYSDVGIYVIQLVMNPVETIKGIKILMRELRKVKEELITKEEMTKITNHTKNETIFASTRPNDMLIYFGLNCLANRNFKPTIKTDFDDYLNIKREDIKDIANKLFVRNKINMYIYGNIDETNFDFIDL